MSLGGRGCPHIESKKIRQRDALEKNCLNIIYRVYIINFRMALGEDAVHGFRAITPGADHAIFFNNAGCSLPSQATLDAVIGYINKEASLGG